MKPLGRRPYTLNQKRQIFADSRLKRGADSDERAIAEQIEDVEDIGEQRPDHDVPEHGL